MNSLKDLYKSISTPEELLNFMKNNIKFGLYGSNKRLYDTSDLDAFELANDIYWNLSSPVNTLKTHYGQIVDQVELERDWFTRNNYEVKTLYITFLVDSINSYPAHAYLAYKDKNKWCWFEACDKANFGIHKYDSLEELITDQMEKHVRYAEKFNPLDDSTLDYLHIFDYSKPKYSINRKEFMDFILNSSEVPIVE